MTRDEIVNAAMSMNGWRFRHQGRGEANMVDCVGLLVVVGRKVGYEKIYDLQDYRRTPSASELRQLLEANMDEVPLDDARRGDVYLMRLDGIKPRHTSIRISDDPGARILHAYGNGKTGRVQIDTVRRWQQRLVAAFRLRGVED